MVVYTLKSNFCFKWAENFLAAVRSMCISVLVIWFLELLWHSLEVRIQSVLNIVIGFKERADILGLPL